MFLTVLIIVTSFFVFTQLRKNVAETRDASPLKISNDENCKHAEAQPETSAENANVFVMTCNHIPENSTRLQSGNPINTTVEHQDEMAVESPTIDKMDVQKLDNVIKPTAFDVRNANAYSSFDTSTQTNTKWDNMLDAMGNPFDCDFVFDKNNRTLQIKDSCVVLTLSEADLDGNTPIRCFASTFRHVSKVYDVLDTVMKENEQITSPTVQYEFPNVSYLRDFASVRMQIVGGFCQNFRVWRVEVSANGELERFEISHLSTFEDSVDSEDVTAYYKQVSTANICFVVLLKASYPVL